MPAVTATFNGRFVQLLEGYSCSLTVKNVIYTFLPQLSVDLSIFYVGSNDAVVPAVALVE
jgi:hypothetical protein